MEKTTFNTNDTDKKAPTPQSPLPPEPRDQQAPRPTGTHQPGQHPEPHGEGQRPRPYPNPARPGQATYPAPQPGYRPTAPVDGPAYPGGNGPQYPGGGYPGGRYPGGPRPMTPGRQGGKSGGSLGLIIGIVAVALVIVGVGCWWYFGYRNSHPILTDDIDVEEVAEIHYPDASSAPSQTEPQQATSSDAAATPQTSASASSAATGVGAGSEAASLFNRPLTYTGTVTPGGVASLNIILFQNGRLEGSIDYSGGKSMPLFGSYTWSDNGNMMNINFTVSSPKDKTYSESWMGQSSHIKDDLAHTLTFKRINTSAGQSMTASFALRQ